MRHPQSLLSPVLFFPLYSAAVSAAVIVLLHEMLFHHLILYRLRVTAHSDTSDLVKTQNSDISHDVFPLFWSCGFVYVGHSVSQLGEFRRVWVTQTLLTPGSFPDQGEPPFSSLLLSGPAMLNLSIKPSLLAVAFITRQLPLHSLLLLSACLLPVTCPLQRPWPFPPALLL